MALALDPLSLSINTGVGVSFYMARRYAEAIEQYRRTLEMGSGFTVAHEHLGSALLQTEGFSEAVEQFREAVRIDESDLGLRASLAHALAVTGRRDEAEKIVVELQDAATERYVSPYFMAEVQTGLGHLNEAFEWLERCYTDRAPHMIFLAVEPKLDPLRHGARFEHLLKRMNLRALT
jgi:serine/threonine-protein kinase